MSLYCTKEQLYWLRIWEFKEKIKKKRVQEDGILLCEIIGGKKNKTLRRSFRREFKNYSCSGHTFTGCDVCQAFTRCLTCNRCYPWKEPITYKKKNSIDGMCSIINMYKAAIIIQKNWRLCRYNPKYKMCEKVQNRNLYIITNEYN